MTPETLKPLVEDLTMTNLLDKARIGRTSALAGLAEGSLANANGPRHRAATRLEKVAFVSTRARMAADTILA
ncbi:MAG: hypothetical protein R3D84_04240 [Paracoccaceae bacterium]